jgi:hypothetical protein
LSHSKSLFELSQWFIPVIVANQEAEIRRIAVQSQLQQIVLETLSQKYPTQKRAGRVAQVVESLPSKQEAPSSNPSTTKKQNKNPYLKIYVKT